jgi:serine/threonine protein kinase
MLKIEVMHRNPDVVPSARPCRDSLCMAQQYVRGECIGRGSFGEVYRAFDTVHRRDVALKLVDLEQADEEIDVSSAQAWILSPRSATRTPK